MVKFEFEGAVAQPLDGVVSIIDRSQCRRHSRKEIGSTAVKGQQGELDVIKVTGGRERFGFPDWIYFVDGIWDFETGDNLGGVGRGSKEDDLKVLHATRENGKGESGRERRALC